MDLSVFGECGIKDLIIGWLGICIFLVEGIKVYFQQS